MKKAILVVCFGTTREDAMKSCIKPVEIAIKAAFPEHEIFCAYSSKMIVNKLQATGIRADSAAEALKKLRTGGFEEIAVVPIFIQRGPEYESVKKLAEGFACSAPLIDNEEDIKWLIKLLSGIAAEERRSLLVMGHGTEQSMEDAYEAIQRFLPENIYLACAVGKHSIDKLLPELEKIPGKRLTLMPLMLTSGVHAHDAMAGDGRDSWKSILESKGFDISVRMQGLGSMEQVQQRFVEKGREIIR